VRLWGRVSEIQSIKETLPSSNLDVELHLFAGFCIGFGARANLLIADAQMMSKLVSDPALRHTALTIASAFREEHLRSTRKQ